MVEMCKVDTINRLEKRRKEIKLSILYYMKKEIKIKKLLLAVRDAPDVKRLTWDRTKGVTSLPRIFR